LNLSSEVFSFSDFIASLRGLLPKFAICSEIRVASSWNFWPSAALQLKIWTLSGEMPVTFKISLVYSTFLSATKLPVS